MFKSPAGEYGKAPEKGGFYPLTQVFPSLFNREKGKEHQGSFEHECAIVPMYGMWDTSQYAKKKRGRAHARGEQTAHKHAKMPAPILPHPSHTHPSIPCWGHKSRGFSSPLFLTHPPRATKTTPVFAYGTEGRTVDDASGRGRTNARF